MSITYIPHRPGVARFSVNTASVTALSKIHRAVGLPCSGDDGDILLVPADRVLIQQTGRPSRCVPCEATADFEYLHRAWQDFLLSCGGYTSHMPVARRIDAMRFAPPHACNSRPNH